MVSGALIFVALVVSGNDAKQRRNSKIQAQVESARVERKALYDATTGLPNRASLANHLVGELARSESDENTFAVLYLDVANHRDIPTEQAENVMAALAKAITAAIDEGIYLARYSSSAFVIIVNDPGHRKHQGMYQRLRNLQTRAEASNMALTWHAGQSVFPSSGRNSRMLIRKAMKTAELSTLGKFNVTAKAHHLPDQFGARSAMP